MKIFALSILIVGAAMAIMAVGVILRGRCFSGACGGEGVFGPDGELLTCGPCPKREELERQAREATTGTRRASQI